MEHAFDATVSFQEFDMKLFKYLIHQIYTSSNILVIKPGESTDTFNLKSPHYNAEYRLVCKGAITTTIDRDSDPILQEDVCKGDK
jgi:hypothetical protein